MKSAISVVLCRGAQWGAMLLAAACSQMPEMPQAFKPAPSGNGSSTTPSGAVSAAAPAPAPSTKAGPSAAPPALGLAAANSVADQLFKPNPAVVAEMLPDRDCSRPLEQFNIVEKATKFGGEVASRRLTRLLETDFEFSDLTPQDKALLRYLAYTTIWLPPEAEQVIGKIYEVVGDKAGNEVDNRAVTRAQDRMALLRKQPPVFPGEPRLVVLEKDGDGISARTGGLITMGPSFLALLDKHSAGRDLVLSHELSHLYKRHHLKEIQFQMISSQQGFKLAKKVLNFRVSGGVVDQAIFFASTLPQIYEFVRGLNVRFGKEQELEADGCALVWMRSAKLDLRRSWDDFRSIAGSGAAGNPQYFAAHPTNAERQAHFVRADGRQTNPSAPTPPTGTRPRSAPGAAPAASGPARVPRPQ